MYGFLIAIWVLVALNVTMAGVKHGEERTGVHNAGATFIDTLITVGLLWGAGFWTQPMLWPKVLEGAMIALGLVGGVMAHGRYRTGQHNFWYSFIGGCLRLAVMSYPLFRLYGWI